MAILSTAAAAFVGGIGSPQYRERLSLFLKYSTTPLVERWAQSAPKEKVRIRDLVEVRYEVV